MNLALRDIRFNLARFAMTAAGIAFLVTAAVGMVGLYRGIVEDALLVMREIGADLWVVQGGTTGPFAEGSSVPAGLDIRIEGVEGVASTRRFLQFSHRVAAGGRAVRATVSALDFPGDRGDWITLVRGRRLASGHFEAIADESLGLLPGDTVELGKDRYTIVGLTRHMVDQMGDGLLFVSLNDALAINRDRTSEEVLLARARGAAAAQGPMVSAVLVTLQPGFDAGAVRTAIEDWGDVGVLSRQDQEDLMLNERLWRLRLQILAFLGVLLIVMAIVISLIIYTMTIEKLHQIAMLKLIGARNGVIRGMIVQQAAAIGVLGFGLGVAISFALFPWFPRQIVLLPGDLALEFLAVAQISGGAALVGIGRAMRVEAKEVLS